MSRINTRLVNRQFSTRKDSIHFFLISCVFFNLFVCNKEKFFRIKLLSLIEKIGESIKSKGPMHKKFQIFFWNVPSLVLCRISLWFSWWSSFDSTMKIRITSGQNLWYNIKNYEISELFNAERLAFTVQLQYAKTLKARHVFVWALNSVVGYQLSFVC